MEYYTIVELAKRVLRKENWPYIAKKDDLRELY